GPASPHFPSIPCNQSVAGRGGRGLRRPCTATTRSACDLGELLPKLTPSILSVFSDLRNRTRSEPLGFQRRARPQSRDAGSALPAAGFTPRFE
ncbi:unnamed protein product, partial [Amoebophrya sp. A120]